MVNTRHYRDFLNYKLKQHLIELENEQTLYEYNYFNKLFRLKYFDSRKYFWSKVRWNIIICEDELERVNYEYTCDKEETTLDTHYNPSFYRWQNQKMS